MSHYKIIGPGIMVVDARQVLKSKEARRQMAVWRRIRSTVLVRVQTRRATDD